MVNQKNISIVIPSLKANKNLRNCLIALSEQSLKPDSVLIVAQSDLTDYSEIIKDIELSIKVLYSPVGLAKSRNLGFKFVDKHCRIVGFVDDDTCLKDNFIEQVANNLVWADACVGIVKTGSEQRLSYPDKLTNITKRNVWKSAIESGFFINTSVLQAVGTYQEDLGLGSGTKKNSGEGTELYCRILNGGFNLVFDPELIAEEISVIRTTDVSKHFSYAIGTGYVYAKHFKFFIGFAHIFAPVFARHKGFTLKTRIAIVFGRSIGFLIRLKELCFK